MDLMLQYPYNPTGTDATCVLRERYALSSTNNTYRCIVPELAPFFQVGLKVIKHPGAVELREGRDYKLGGRYHEVAAIANSDLYGIIEFIDPEILGEIEIEYSTIGGTFTQANNKLLTYLANYLIDPATTTWESVINKLIDFPMEDHEQHWADFVNKQYIANSIDGIEKAITAKSTQNDTLSVAYLNNRITQLDQLVTASKFNEHIASLANPHKSSAAKVHALPAGGNAVDTFKAYANTLAELAAYINASGLTQAELDAFMLKEGDNLIGNKLILKDGFAKIRSNGVTSEISLADSGIVITCKGVNKVGADRMRNKAGKSAKLQAGRNVLKVRSNGLNPGRDDLTINDVVIIHLGNIRQYIGGIDFGYVYVTTGSTATATMTGDGTPNNPVRLDVIYPAATDTVKGIGMIVQGYGNNANAWGTAKALADLVSDLSGYVPVTRTINGHPLSADVILAAADFDLELTNNTSDVNKPISTQQQSLLNQYVDIVHQHSLAEMAIENASTTVSGVTLLYPDVLGSDVGAVSPSAFQAALDSLAKQEALLADMIDRNSLPVNSLIGKLEIVRGTNAWDVEFASTQSMYYDRAIYDVSATSINLATIFGAGNVANKQFYIYAKTISPGVAAYTALNAERANSDGYLLAGVIHTDSTGVVPGSYNATQSFGPFMELIDHINDPNAHMSGGQIKADYGLGLVENYEAVNTLIPFSPYATLNEWLVPSDQTAGLADGWKLSPEGDSIVVDITGPSVPLVHTSRVANVNMWEHQVTQPNGNKVASLVLRMSNDKVPVTTHDDAVTRGAIVLVGTVRNGVKDYQLALEHILDSGSLTDQWSLKNGLDKTLLGKATVNDRYQLVSAVELPFKKMFKVSWITKTDNTRLIRVESWFGDAKTRGDMLTGELTEAMVNSNANAKAAFNSGRFGLDFQYYQKSSFSIDEVTLNISKKKFITANVLLEAMRIGSGVRVLTGTLAAGAKSVPMPLGTSTGFVIQSIRNWQDDTGGTLNNYMLDNFTLTGNEGPGAASISTEDRPSRDTFYQQRYCTINVIKNSAIVETAVPTNFMSVGFINHINFNIVD